MVRRMAGAVTHSVLILLIAATAGAQTRTPARPPARPAAKAAAKKPTPKAVIDIDGAYRVTSQTFIDTAAPVINAEPAKIATTYDVPASMVFRGGATVRVWKMLGAGVSVSHFSSSGDGSIAATIPHPFEFAKGRNITAVASNLTRSETGVALLARVFLPVSRRVSASIFGGPEWVSASGERVTDIDYSESYPYDTVTFQSSTTADWKQTKLVPSVGGDINYFFAKQVGVGFGARYSGGNIDIPSISGETVKSKVGGFVVGVGLRLRF
jgi:hypothetical protein